MADVYVVQQWFVSSEDHEVVAAYGRLGDAKRFAEGRAGVFLRWAAHDAHGPSWSGMDGHILRFTVEKVPFHG